MEPTGAPPGGVHTEGGGPSREPRWAEPEDVSAAPDDCVLSAEQVEQWRTQRYLVLDGLFPAQLIAEAVTCHTDEFPTPTPERPGAELAVDAGGGFGGIGTSREFPFDEAHDVYNMLTLHPRALKACEQLLDTSDLRVTRSNYGAKYGGGGFEKPRTAPDQNGWDASVTGDQTMHWDYGNNTMLVPSAERPDCVAGICYLNHVEDGGGATGIVPYDPNLPTHSDMPGEGVEGWGRSDGWVGQSVYEAERLVRYRPGTILLYRMDTYHRGTLVYPEGVRRVWGAVWRRADSDWGHAGGQGMHGVGNGAFALYAHIFPRITPAQRTVVGFPSVESDYWTPTTIAAVDKRYPGCDWTEYKARL